MNHISSPNISDEAIERKLQQGKAPGPRVTPQQVENVQVTGQYYVFPNTNVTVCCITLRNGFAVIGESSSVSAANFDPQIGRELAHKNAADKIWALEGYALRERLARGEAA